MTVKIQSAITVNAYFLGEIKLTVAKFKVITNHAKNSTTENG